MGVKMKQDGVYEDELRELAAQINFPINNDDDLIRLFHEAKKLGFWPDLDVPRPGKDGFHIPRTGEPKTFTQVHWGCMGGLPEEAEYTILKGGKIKATWPSPARGKKLVRQQKQELLLELERLTKLADALEGSKTDKNDDIDDFLNKI